MKSVDKSAKAAGKSPTKHDRGFRTGKIGKSNLTGGSSSLFPAKGQEQIIHIYRSSLIRKTGYRVYFDLFDEPSGQYREKCRAYVTEALVGELHRGHSYRVNFNAEPRNPTIVAILEEVHDATMK